MGGDWGSRIISGLSAALAPSGFHISSFPYLTPDDGSGRARVLEKVDQVGDTLAGTLVFIFAEVAGVLEELDQRNIPWVTINRPTHNATQNFVTHDAFRGGRIIARCFARMGFDRVAVLSDPLAMGRSSVQKFQGFVNGWIEAGKPLRNVDFLYCPTFHEDLAHDVFMEHVRQHGPPQAVFTTGDYFALGVIRACRELGLAVPGQVAVVASTGFEFAAHASPSLTLLETPMEQMGAAAGQILLEMAREGVRRMTGRCLKADLIVRESCPIPPDVLAQETAAVDRSP
jgi:DNA-binding LacI/PurR family transcriptional regulator